MWDATTAKQHGSDVQAPTRVPGTDLDLPPAIAFSPDGRLVALSKPRRIRDNLGYGVDAADRANLAVWQTFAVG